MTFLCSEGKNISLTSCKEKRGTFIFYSSVMKPSILMYFVINRTIRPFVCEVTFFL